MVCRFQSSDWGVSVWRKADYTIVVCMVKIVQNKLEYYDKDYHFHNDSNVIAFIKWIYKLFILDAKYICGDCGGNEDLCECVFDSEINDK